MPPLRALREGLTDESLRLAILVGLATVPFTVALSWVQVSDDVVAAGGSISAGPILLAGLLVGYYYSDRETESRRAGIWTGFAGSIAVILVFAANTIRTIGSGPREWIVAAVIATPFALAFAVGLIVAFTMFAAQFADWATQRLRRRRRPDTASSGTATGADPKWRYAIAAYVLLAPAVLYYALWLVPEGGVEVGLSILGLIVLIPLSVVVLVGLFVDATAPRTRASEWLPSVRAYVGVPIGTYALVYAAAALLGSTNPAGFALYGFMGVLWLSALVYLCNRYRHDGGRDSAPGLPS